MIVSTDNESKKAASKEEINVALDKVFSKMTDALQKKEEKRITLERVDETLNALFDAINRAQYEGSNIKVPDFQRIINGEF